MQNACVGGMRLGGHYGGHGNGSKGEETLFHAHSSCNQSVEVGGLNKTGFIDCNTLLRTATRNKTACLHSKKLVYRPDISIHDCPASIYPAAKNSDKLPAARIRR